MPVLNSACFFHGPNDEGGALWIPSEARNDRQGGRTVAGTPFCLPLSASGGGEIVDSSSLRSSEYLMRVATLTSWNENTGTKGGFQTRPYGNDNGLFS